MNHRGRATVRCCVTAMLACAALVRASVQDTTPQRQSEPPPCGPAAGSPVAGGPAAGSAESDAVRRRPGAAPAPETSQVECHPNRLPRVSNDEMLPPEPVPNRWRLADELGYRVDLLDPYHGNNPLKGDWPVFGGDDFLSVSAISGTLLEARRIASGAAGAPDAKGERTATRGELFYNESVALDAVLYRGDTVFRPPDWQWRFTTVVSASGAHAAGGTNHANTAAVQALSFEKHLRDVSVHDDFDSARVGIQPLTSDFRGFLLSDQPLAVRLFGTRDNNVFQYNVALFRSLRKNSVSLNDLGARLPHDDAVLGNLYWQDFPRTGVTSDFVIAYNRNREAGMQELLDPAQTANALAVRARHDYDVLYLGYGLDGHFGRLNATAMTYGLLGRERQATFVDAPARLQAWFAAAELSVDFDVKRWRLSLLHASGDANARDRHATGFAGLTATPVFAGTDSSFFIHQQLALRGGGFNLKSRNALLPALNPIDSGGQDNFTNPGLDLAGLGMDLDILPTWRVSIDANQLWLDQPGVLEDLMLRPVARNFGAELAVNAFWRPFANQNLILRLSNSVLLRGAGYRSLYDGGTPYSAFVFVTLSY